MKKEKTWYKIGLILGIVVIVVGIIMMVAPPEHAGYNSIYKDTSFGGDFYTYQYDATKDAVNNTANIVRQLRYIGDALGMYFGSAFVLVGLLIVLDNGKKLALGKDKPAPAPEAVHVPVVGTVTVTPNEEPVKMDFVGTVTHEAQAEPGLVVQPRENLDIIQPVADAYADVQDVELCPNAGIEVPDPEPEVVIDTDEQISENREKPEKKIEEPKEKIFQDHVEYALSFTTAEGCYGYMKAKCKDFSDSDREKIEHILNLPADQFKLELGRLLQSK